MTRIITRFMLFLCFLGIVATFLYAPKFFERVKESRSISVLAWPNILDAEYLQDFEKETGIKVYLSYFESYEELFAKLYRGGGVGYDLVMGSDYVVPKLIAHDLLKELDHSRIASFNDIHPFLLNHSFDPGNKFDIPIGWSAYGIGVDTDYFGGKIPEGGWSLLFDRKHGDYKVGMIDDARETVLPASYYLFGPLDVLEGDKVDQVEDLLVKQREWVALYTDQRSDQLLLSKAAPVVFAMNPDLSRAIKENKNIVFIIPEEGSFVVIDSLVIPKATMREDFVYQFINYLYRPEVLQKYVDRYGFFSPIKGVSFDREHLNIPMSLEELFKKLHFFDTVISNEVLSRLWIAVRS